MATLFSKTKSTAKKTTKKAKSIRDHKVYGKQCAYILDSIEIEGKSRPSDKTKINYLVECFNDEYNYAYNKRIYPNLQQRIAEWLMGLPSCIHVAFTYHDIIEQGKEWGFCQTKRKEDEFCNRWWSVLAFRIMQCYDYYNKPQTIYQKLR